MRWMRLGFILVVFGCSGSNGNVDSGVTGDVDSARDVTPLQDVSANDSGSMTGCEMPPGGVLEEVDFRKLSDITPFTDGSSWLRAVYKSSAPLYMSIVAGGLRHRYDADQGTGYLDNPYRSELRQVDNGPPATDTTQVYRIQFTVDELPSTLYGPLIIFQRFDDGRDGPDLAIELSSVHQFPSTASPNSLQIIDHFEGRTERQRFVDTFLGERNELLVAIRTAQVGKYVVFLNGEKLVEWNDINTVPSAATWLQYGVYWHGVIRDKYAQRAEQVASGESVVTFVEHRVEKYEYQDDIDFALLKSHDPNVDGFRCL